MDRPVCSLTPFFPPWLIVVLHAELFHFELNGRGKGRTAGKPGPCSGWWSPGTRYWHSRTHLLGPCTSLVREIYILPMLEFLWRKKNEPIQITLYVMCPLVCSRCEPLASGPRRPHPPISDIGQWLFQPLGVPPQSSLQGHTNAGSLRFV